MEDAAKTLVDEAPFFRFRTWKGEPATSGPYKGKDPQVQHVWEGATDYEQSDDDDVQDETKDDGESPKRRRGKTAKEAEPVETDEIDLNALGEEADAADPDAVDNPAQLQLSELCEASDLDPDNYQTWTDVAEALSSGANGEGVSESADENESGAEDDNSGSGDDFQPPEKEDHFMFRPPRKRKSVECICTAVTKGKETCNLKNLADNTIYKGVPWSKLEELA
jgi:hypothetical protein